MNRCNNCILPTNYPGIQIDDKGTCNYCNNYKEPEFVVLESFVKNLKTFNDTKKERDKEYDCLLGFSGGRDSTYLLYILTKKLGLNVLAYSADHGYVPEQTILNMKRATDKLNVKLVIDKHDFLFCHNILFLYQLIFLVRILLVLHTREVFYHLKYLRLL